MAEGNSRSSRAAQGISRVLAKLKTSLESGKYYEAHQMYRTLYFRYSSQEKYSELEDLLYEGAVKFFTLNQNESGIDLSKLYLEILVKGGKSPDETSLQRISKLYMFFPWSSPDRESFKNDSVRWSSGGSGGQHQKGHPRLHQLLAYALWSAKRYPESRHHFLYSADGSGCGLMLVEFHTTSGFPREMDLFVTGTVLQLICLKKNIEAAYTLKAYTEKHPSIQRGPPYKHPLLNFVWLLLLAIEHRPNIAAFSTLVEKYRPSIVRDPTYLEYIDKIGQNFFGLAPPARPRPGGMFSGIFDSLLNVLGDEEDETSGASSSVRPNRRIPASTTSSSSRMETEDVE